MSKKRQLQKTKTSATNEGIQANVINARAIAVGRNATAIANNEPASDTISATFNGLKEIANTIPNKTDQDEAVVAISTLEQEARKGNKAEEKVVRKWINFLFETAPDVWEVAVNTLINPIQGVSTVFQKVAERSKKEKADKD